MSAPTVRERLWVLGILLACVGSYFLWWGAPYLIFYCLPFVVLSFVFGVLWTYLCQKGKLEFARLAILIPATAGLTILIVGFPHEPLFLSPLVNQPHKIPELYDAFNRVNGWFQSCLVAITPGVLAKWLGLATPYQPVSYDLKQVAQVTWAAVLAGAPCVFFYFFKQLKADEHSALEYSYLRRTEEQECRVEAIEAECRKETDAIKHENTILWHQHNNLRSENKKLKALLEFQKKGKKELAPNSNEEKTKGIFGSDLL